MLIYFLVPGESTHVAFNIRAELVHLNSYFSVIRYTCSNPCDCANSTASRSAPTRAYQMCRVLAAAR